jgi:hypothetical protein
MIAAHKCTICTFDTLFRIRYACSNGAEEDESVTLMDLLTPGFWCPMLCMEGVSLFLRLANLRSGIGEMRRSLGRWQA